MGSSPLQGLENCLREIPVPRPQPAWSWSSAGDRGPRRAEPKNWMAEQEGKAWLPGCLGARKGTPKLGAPRPASPSSGRAHTRRRDRRCPGNSRAEGLVCGRKAGVRPAGAGGDGGSRAAPSASPVPATAAECLNCGPVGPTCLDVCHSHWELWGSQGSKDPGGWVLRDSGGFGQPLGTSAGLECAQESGDDSCPLFLDSFSSVPVQGAGG